MLLGAAKILSEMKEDIPGEIRFFFQEREKTFSGAKKIIEAGGMLGYKNEKKESIYYPHHEKFKIDEDYLKFGIALHVQFALDFLNS